MATEHQADLDVVIVGAGLAGLSCAKHLQRAGKKVAIYEASAGVGGRVRTDNVDGLLLDRGFQLYNPSYPEGAHILDLKALDLQPLTAGVIVSIDGRNYRMGNPKHEPTWAVDSLLAPVGPLKAKMGFAKYAAGIALGTEKSDAIDQRTGEPTLIQRVHTRGLHPRTFTIDPSGKLLIAANKSPVPVREGGIVRVIPACMDMFRINADGRLDYVRKYEIDVGDSAMDWVAMMKL